MNEKVDDTGAGIISAETADSIAREAAAPDTPGQPGSADRVDQAGRRAVGRSWFTTLLLFTLLAATVGAGGYLALEINRERKADQAEIRALAQRLDTLQQSNASLAENVHRLDSRLARLDEQLAGIAQNLDNLQRLGGGAANWRLVELRQLLRVAAQRLALAGDLDTVQTLLQSAAAGLREIPDPALIPVREQLRADINRLKTSAGSDVADLALALGGLAQRADQLPLNLEVFAEPEQAPAADPVSADQRWRRFAYSLWQELKSLLVISRTEQHPVALLAPRERFFLQRNLRLQLEAARLAVLIRDGDQLRQSAKACLEWLHEFFDTSDNRVRHAREILETAAATDLEQPVLSIDATLHALDEYLARQGNPVVGDVARQ